MSGYGDISRAVTLGSTSRRPAPLITTANRQSISQSSHPPQHTLSSSPSRSPPAPDPAAVALVVPGGHALSSSPARRRRRCPPPSHPASLSSAQRIKPAAFAAKLLRVPSCVLRRPSPVARIYADQRCRRRRRLSLRTHGLVCHAPPRLFAQRRTRTHDQRPSQPSTSLPDFNSHPTTRCSGTI